MSLPVNYTSAELMLNTLSAIGSISTLTNSSLLFYAGAAEALINAKISKKYTLPIVDSIPLLETLATDLAIYNVLSARISLRTDAGNHPWFQRFKNAIDILDDIANGSLTLINSAGTVLVAATNTDAMYSTTMDYVPTTGEIPDSLQGPDPNKVQDSLDKRNLHGFKDILL